MNVKLNILSSKDFENNIKSFMKEKSPITMIDAIVLYCQSNNMEMETAAALISTKMKNVIEAEAIQTGMIKNKKAKLPLQ